MEEIRQSQVVAKRLWNVVRMALLMIRKGVVSKRKLMMDMNLMMKRGRVLRKSLSNLISHHHSQSKMTRGGFGIQEYYEFSCSNSPNNPVFSHVAAAKRNNQCHHYSYYFPCINSPQVMMDQMEEYVHHVDVDEPYYNKVDQAAVVSPLVPKTPDYYTFNFRFDGGVDQKMMRSPLNVISPFSVRVSNYSSSEDIINDHIHLVEEEDQNENENGPGVDDQAEEFITRFYEQLRAQSRSMQLLKDGLPHP